MKTKKKNRFLTFCFSFLPGAAEMYMGFMKMGVSMMSIFFLTIVLCDVLRADVICLLAGVVIWFYGFFHANHMAALSDEEFGKVEDNYLLAMDTITGGKELIQNHYKLIAGLLIFVGVILLWNATLDVLWNILPANVWNIVNEISDYVPRVVVAVLVIFAGCRLIKGRKAQLAEIETAEKTEEEV